MKTSRKFRPNSRIEIHLFNTISVHCKDNGQKCQVTISVVKFPLLNISYINIIHIHKNKGCTLKRMHPKFTIMFQIPDLSLILLEAFLMESPMRSSHFSPKCGSRLEHKHITVATMKITEIRM